MRLSGWMLVVAIVLSVAGVAHAQDRGGATSAEKEQANALFKRALEAYKKRRYKDAIDWFREADRLYPSPVLSFNTARAYDDMGDNSGALRFYRAYLRQKPDARDRDEVGARISELEALLRARGVQQVTVLSEPDGATAIIDGRPVGVTPWTGELMPGRHRLKLRREGYLDATSEFELLPHRAMDVTTKLDVAPEAPPPAPAPAAAAPVAPVVSEAPKDEPKPERESGGISPWTWGAFGLGVAAFAGAGVFELLRADAADDVRAERTQLGRIEAYDTMEERQTTARILAVVGAVGVVAGGVLLYFDLSSGNTAEPSASVAVGCAPGNCGAALRGRF